MNIHLAEVEDMGSLALNGSFSARLRGSSDPIIVNYTSPFNSNGVGGFVAIPSKGQEILVCNPKGSDGNWYYLASTFNLPAAPSDDVDNQVTQDSFQHIYKIDKEMYRATGKPMRYIFKSPLGHTLLLSDEYSPEFFNVKAELISAGGKRLSLVDSPKTDAISLKNEHGDGLRITGITTELPNAPRAIDMESFGPQRYVSRESGIDVIVADGRELNIANRSTGANVNPNEPEKYGNVNIESTEKDVNIRGGGPDSRIFIKCIDPAGTAAQLIEIETKGSSSTIKIHSEGKVEIVAKQGLSIESGSDIDLAANGNINMGAAGQININGQAGNNIDGVTVDLNSGKANVPNTLGINPVEDNYQDKKVY